MSTVPPALAELGLKALPFPKAPPHDELFRWPPLEELLARLHFVLGLRGIVLLTGDAGGGKSTAIRCFCHGLDESRHPTVYLADKQLSPKEFYSRILEHFGILPGRTYSSARRQCQTLLADMSATRDMTPIVIIDEAHELSPDMVQELRYVQNIYCDADSPFTLVLSGQSELRATLRLRAFEAVAQRITVRYHLPGLTLAQTTSYITHSLTRAGIDRPLFTEAAINLLHTHSRGILRRIGLLATHALLDTALNKTPLVEEASVRRAITELDD
ncbi:MAG: AAA family ATPase [Peptococcaceae bacterium]|jgi:type II secretory pathway predicted ATPase ExeA|nr:AAA family ATPase [Peptococcaceae bacterium]